MTDKKRIVNFAYEIFDFTVSIIVATTMFFFWFIIISGLVIHIRDTILVNISEVFSSNDVGKVLLFGIILTSLQFALRDFNWVMNRIFLMDRIKYNRD